MRMGSLVTSNGETRNQKDQQGQAVADCMGSHVHGLGCHDEFGAEQDGKAAMDYMSNQNAKTLNPIARKNQQFTRNQLNM
jgi:hypothetical protein